MAAAPAAFGEVWGYVDDAGQPHVASKQLDSRYQLFFKGDPEKDAGAAPAQAAAADTTPAVVVISPKMQRLVDDPASQRFARLIEQHAARASVDPALIKAIVAAESGFVSGAVSRQGALGLMQVMPQTAARYGVSGDKKRSAEEKLLDPGVNLQVGTRYLRDLLARFADNLSLALAAYNAGEYAVERYNNRIPPYPETVEYVKRVQQLYAAFRPPAVAQVVQTTDAAATGTFPRRKGVSGTFFAQPKVAQGSTDPVL